MGKIELITEKDLISVEELVFWCIRNRVGAIHSIEKCWEYDDPDSEDDEVVERIQSTTLEGNEKNLKFLGLEMDFHITEEMQVVQPVKTAEISDLVERVERYIESCKLIQEGYKDAVLGGIKKALRGDQNVN